MEDLEVIETYLKSQSNSCFSLLYNRYSGKVYAKCLSFLKDTALAKDATQEIFLKVFLNLTRFAGKARFSTWIYSITYNYCIDFLRKHKKYGMLFAEDIEQAPDIAEEDVPDEALFQMEVSMLKRVLEEIPVGDKMVLLMKYQDDMSIRDIAELTDKTESAIKMKIKRAKAKAKARKEELSPQR